MLQSFFECKNNNTKICVIGLGLSGRAAVEYLIKNGFRVVVLESLSEEVFEKKNLGVIDRFRRQGAEIFFDISDREKFFVDNLGFVLLSPGVKPHSDLVKGFSHVTCASEFEISLLLSKKKAVLITGSNGKSTTASLVSHMLSHASISNILCGNIGTPIFNTLEACSQGDPLLVVEASSYQLETLQTLIPYSGVFLNLSLNHLERHQTMERYFDAKCVMFEMMKEGAHAVIDVDSEWGMRAFEKFSKKLQVVAVTSVHTSLRGAYATAFINKDCIKIEDKNVSISTSSSSLIGEHNIRNIAVAASVATLLSVGQEEIQSSLTSFNGLPHRLERIEGEKLIFNDSKSTTPLSSVSGLRAVASMYADKKIILMLGGKAKPGGFSDLKNEIENTPMLSKIIFFGGSGEEMSLEIGYGKFEIFSSLKEATFTGVHALKENEVLLLSPGCASFDEFNDFEHRGECYKEYVREALR